MQTLVLQSLGRDESRNKDTLIAEQFLSGPAEGSFHEKRVALQFSSARETLDEQLWGFRLRPR